VTKRLQLFPVQIPDKRAFTLVELLVSLAVLSVLVVLLAQVITLTGQAIAINTTKLDAAKQARLFFDRLATDLALRPRRTDLGMQFLSVAGSDSFQFYSQVDGYSGTRHIAAVGYRIGTVNGNISGLERGATGTDWLASGNPLIFLPKASVPPPPDSDYELLAAGIFRLEICYLLNTGALTTVPKSDFSNVSALVVAIGVLDENSRKILSDAQLSQLAGALKDVTDLHDPISIWNTELTGTGFASGIPPRAVKNLRLYQRIFLLP
jgi:prepilin-type N-terminal cleavage/methylation domain-containing protein